MELLNWRACIAWQWKGAAEVMQDIGGTGNLADSKNRRSYRSPKRHSFASVIITVVSVFANTYLMYYTPRLTWTTRVNL